MTDTSNWVHAHADAHANCTVDRIFEELKQAVKRDVERVRELPAEKRGKHQFQFSANDAKREFRVERFY